MASRNFQNYTGIIMSGLSISVFLFAIQNTRLGGCLLSVVFLVCFFHFLKLMIICNNKYMDKHVKLKEEHIKLKEMALRCSVAANVIDLVFFRGELSPSEDEIQ